MLKAVGFDLGDTLLEYASVPLSWESEYRAALQRVAATIALEFTSDHEHAAIAILSKYNTRRNPRTNEVGAEQIFKEILVEWKHDSFDSVAAIIESFFVHFRQNLQAFPDASRLLPKLKALGISYGVFTDVPYGMPREYVLADIANTDLSIPNSCVLTSLNTGCRKPDPRTIATLAGALGSTPNEFVYVGNERKDIEAAKNSGCKGVLVWRSNEQAPDWGQDCTLQRLDDLTKVFDH